MLSKENEAIWTGAIEQLVIDITDFINVYKDVAIADPRDPESANPSTQDEAIAIHSAQWLRAWAEMQKMGLWESNQMVAILAAIRTLYQHAIEQNLINKEPSHE